MQNQNPLASLKHVRLLRHFFWTIGAWPSEVFEEKSYRKLNTMFIIFATCTNITGEFNYLFRKMSSLTFIDLGELYLTIFLTFMTLVLAILPMFKNYGQLIKQFLTEYHLINFRHRGEYYEEIYNKANKFSHYFTLLMLSYSIVGPIFFNLVPLYNNYNNGVYSNMTQNYTIQFSIYYYHAFFNPEEHIVTASLINLYLSYFCAVLVCGMDLLMSLMVFQIIGHIKCLIHDLQNIAKPKQSSLLDVTTEHNGRILVHVEKYNAEENKFVHGRIADFVKHHRLIVNFADFVSNFFGPVLALTYLYHLVSCALLLLECSQLSIAALARYGPLTLIIFYQLIQISVTFEVITSESDKLKDEVYAMPWECMDNSNRKLIWIFLNRIQIPIRVSALGMVEVGVQAMASILKTTFSYYAFFRTMSE